jgi:zinc protease
VISVAVLALAAAASAAEPTPRHPRELPAPPPLDFRLPDLARSSLSRGIPMYGLEDHDLPLVTVAIRFPLGTRYVDAGDLDALELMAQAWQTGGTRDLDPDAYDARLAALDAQIHVGIGERSCQVTASCVRDDLDEVLALWRDVVVHPRFDEGRLARGRAKRIRDLQAINDDPGRVASVWLSWLARGRDHPGARLPTRAALDSVGVEALRRIHRRFVDPKGAVIGASGDFDPRDMKRTLDRLFADWRGAPDYAPPRLNDWPVAAAPGLYLLPGSWEQSHVEIGRHVPGLGRRSPDHAAAQILDFAVGYGRIFYRSRSEGLSYGASMFLDADDDDALLEAFGSCRPEATADMAAMLVDELRKARQNPPDESEIATSRTFRVGGVISTSEVPRRAIGTRIGDIAEGRGEDFLKKYLAGLQACGPEDVRRVAERCLAEPSGMVVLVLGDPEKFGRPLAELGLGEPVRLEPAVFGE